MDEKHLDGAGIAAFPLIDMSLKREPTLVAFSQRLIVCSA